MGGARGYAGTRQDQGHQQSATRVVGQRQMAAMGLDDMPGDAQPQAAATGVAAARGLEAHEGGEDPFACRGGDTGAPVADAHPQRRRVVVETHLGALAVEDGVLQQVGQAAFQGHGLGGQRSRLTLDPDHAVLQRKLLCQALEEGTDIEGFDVLLQVQSLHRVQGTPHQFVELVEGRAEALGLLRVLEHLGAQPQPRDGRLEVVRDRREQPLALLHLVTDAPLHAVEGHGGGGDLPGAALAQRRGIQVVAETMCRSGQTRQGAGGAADTEPRQADHREQYHQQHEEPVRRQPFATIQPFRHRQQGGHIEPLLRLQGELDDQDGLRWRRRQQAVLPPARRQVTQRHLVVEQPEGLGARELDHRIAHAQLGRQHPMKVVDDECLQFASIATRHGQAVVVDADEESRSAHVAQLVEHDVPVVIGQRAEEAHRGGHAVGHVPGQLVDASALAGTLLCAPDGVAGQLRPQHPHHHDQQEAAAQGARQQAGQATAPAAPGGAPGHAMTSTRVAST